MTTASPVLRPVRFRASLFARRFYRKPGALSFPMTDNPKSIRESLHKLAYRAQFGVEEEEAKPVLNRAKNAVRFFDNEIQRKLEEIKTLHQQHERIRLLLSNAERAMMDHFEKQYEQQRKAANAAISQAELRRYVFTRDGAMCRSCKATTMLTVDHIVPVIAGGGNELSNLQTLCRSCNCKKGASTLATHKV